MSERWEEDGDPWIVNSVAQAFENDWFRIDAHDVLRPDGAPGQYGVIRVRRLAVGVLPIDADGSVFLVGQWRFPLGRYSWEMPEGGAPMGEDPFDAVRRELAEEAGVPPYVIFHDAVLRAMASERPATRSALGAIPGVGAKKLEAWGDAFLSVIRQF